jgi:hypothetical protein
VEAILFPPGAFQVEGGTVTSTKRPDMNMTVKACGDCRTMLYHNDKTGLDIVSTTEYRRSYNVKDLPDGMKPQFHCWYQERIMDIADSDGLPKFADVPEAFGGTGKMLNSDGSPVIVG